MKQLNNFFLLIFVIGIFNSCTKKLELSAEEQLLLDAKNKIAKLDKLYDQAFEDPIKADKDFKAFVQNELFTKDENFLNNQDVLWHKLMTDLTIRMCKNFKLATDTLSNANAYTLYKAKFKTVITNKIIFGELPQQLKYNNRYSKFEIKRADIVKYFDDKISTFFANNTANANLLNKHCTLTGNVAYNETFTEYYYADFDFTFKEGNKIEGSKFFFFPCKYFSGLTVITKTEGVMPVNVNATKWISEPKYVVYNDKILFYFHFKSSYNPLDEKGEIEREWVYEYNYSIESDGSLKLFNPKVSFFQFPINYVSEPDGVGYKKNIEALKSFTLKVE